MQTASPELVAAILASERRPVQLIEVDWDGDGFGGPGTIDDLSADVVSVSVDRDLSTDLPAEVKLFAGYSAAEAIVTLARQSSSPVPSVTTVPYGAPIAYGDANYSYAGTGPPTIPAGPITHTTWYYSPYNTASPLYGKRRKGAPARISIGMVGANGPEYLQQLVGRVRSLQVRSKSRDVELIIDDLSMTMRKQVSLPMVIADGETATTDLSPGLNTSFMVDWVARKCGYYASPPPRSTTGVLANMHGSGWPEVGTLAQFKGANGSMLPFSPSTAAPTPAKWVQAVNLNGSDDQLLTYVTAGVNNLSTNNGDACFFEAWVRFNTISTGTISGQIIMEAYRTGTQVPFVSLWVDANGRLQSDFNRGGSDATNRTTGTSGPLGFVAGQWYYVGCYWAFTSTDVKVWFRKDSATTGPISVPTPSVTNAPFINTLGVGRGPGGSYIVSYLNGLISDVQFTPENTGTSNPPTFNDAFIPTATVMADEPNLVATPPTIKEEGWAILQEISGANFATAGFDEPGTFRYYTRKRWQQAPFMTSQRTLTAVDSITDLASTETIDQVRNRIIVRAKTPTVIGFGQIWVLNTRIQIAGGASRTIFMNLDGPCANIDTIFNYSSDGAVGSRYLAGTARNGDGAQISNLTITATILSPTVVKVVVTNPNSSTIWLTADASAPGLPANLAGRAYLVLAGQRVMFEEVTNPDPGSQFIGVATIRSEASDSASITAYGEQLLEIPDSAWRQDPDAIDGLAQDLLTQLKDPRPVLQDVPLVGDPRLQLGDRVTLQDPDGLALSQDVHLSSVHTEFGQDSGLGQTVNVRPA